MRVRDALKAGIRRVHGAKRVLFLAYGVNLAVAVALGAVLAEAIEASLGSSLAAENLQQGFDDLWYRSFASQARGLSSTFDPTVVGIGAVFNGLDAFLQGKLFGGYAGIVAVGLFYLLMWTFLSAGFISTYAAGAEAQPFLAQAARFFWRFLVLAAIAGVLYFLIFHFVLRGLSNGVEALTRDVIDERVVFLYTLVKYLLVLVLVYAVNLTFDYSKILTVVRNHRNPLTAPLQGLGFVARQIGRTARLYVSLGLVWIGLVLLYWLIVPGARQASWVAILGVFLIGQVYVLSRIWTRCLFYASQTAMYENLSAVGDEGVV